MCLSYKITITENPFTLMIPYLFESTYFKNCLHQVLEVFRMLAYVGGGL